MLKDKCWAMFSIDSSVSTAHWFTLPCTHYPVCALHKGTRKGMWRWDFIQVLLTTHSPSIREKGQVSSKVSPFSKLCICQAAWLCLSRQDNFFLIYMEVHVGQLCSCTREKCGHCSLLPAATEVNGNTHDMHSPL